jgi:hypothetical protein
MTIYEYPDYLRVDREVMEAKDEEIRVLRDELRATKALLRAALDRMPAEEAARVIVGG